MGTPFISIVITVLNMDKTISKCLDSMLDLDYPKDMYEIVITDGGSKDNTVKIIKEYIEKTKQPIISIFFCDGWPSAGRNEALKQVHGEFIAVTDADMIVSRKWLKDYVEIMEDWNDEKLAGIGGPNITATHDLASRSISCIPIHGPTLDEVPIFGDNRYTKDFITSDFIYATVCRNSFYRKKALDSIGRFDERFFGAEDPELNRRLLDAGYKLAYTKKALVYHHHHSTVRTFFRQQRKYSLWQAVANKLHPSMSNFLHPLPFITSMGFLGIVLLTVLFHPLVFLLLLGLIIVFFGLLVYGLKCAIIKEDPILLLSVPFYAFIWQMAWVIGYPTGVLQRDSLLAKGSPPKTPKKGE